MGPTIVKQLNTIEIIHCCSIPSFTKVITISRDNIKYIPQFRPTNKQTCNNTYIRPTLSQCDCCQII